MRDHGFVVAKEVVLPRKKSRRLKICLAASGGGHLRQLLEIAAVLARHDHFLVTEDTSLSRSLNASYRVHFLPHFALGQARVAKPITMVRAGIANLAASARIIWSEKPTLVVTTGAGSVFFCVLLSRLLGAKVVAIETFARFDRPSAFAKLTMPFAFQRVVQSVKLANVWRRTKVFEPFKILPSQPAAKEPLLFVTVGATLPFPRLLGMVAEAHHNGDLPYRIVAQTGEAIDLGPDIEVFPTLPNSQMIDYLRRADVVVCHGGTGSIVTAMREGCHVIAVPRRAKLMEHYDEHQLEIVRALEVRGLLQSAETAEELEAAIIDLKNRPRVFATTDTQELNQFLERLVSQTFE